MRWRQWFGLGSRVERLRSVIGVILLSILANALWEIILRPGMGGLGRLAMGAITLGSTRMRDAAYANAALDPSMIPATVLLYLFVVWAPSAVLGVASARLMLAVRRGATDKLISVVEERIAEGDRAGAEQELKKVEQKIRSTRIRLHGFEVLLVGIALAAGMTTFTVINQAVLIRRVFTANLTICVPAMSAEQVQAVQASFAGMTSKTDYSAVERRLKDVAAAHGLTLHTVKLW